MVRGRPGLQFLSYYLTTAGGRYFVATGAVIWGFIQSCKGVYNWMKIKYNNGEFSAFWRMAGAAVCTVVLIGYLFTLSSRILIGKEPLLDTPQSYACAQTGVHLTLPAGFTALETVEEIETEPTWDS